MSLGGTVRRPRDGGATAVEYALIVALVGVVIVVAVSLLGARAGGLFARAGSLLGSASPSATSSTLAPPASPYEVTAFVTSDEGLLNVAHLTGVGGLKVTSVSEPGGWRNEVPGSSGVIHYHAPEGFTGSQLVTYTWSKGTGAGKVTGTSTITITRAA